MQHKPQPKSRSAEQTAGVAEAETPLYYKSAMKIILKLLFFDKIVA